MGQFRKLINEEVQGINDQNYGPIIITLMAFIGQVHVWHLLARTGHKHSVLGEIYEELTPIADSLAEAFIGQGGKLENMNYTIRTDYRPSTVVSKMNQIRNLVTDSISDDPKFASFVDSLIQVQKVIDSKLYKFNLK